MDADPYDQLRREYVGELEAWELVRVFVKERLEALTRAAFLPAVVDARVKQVSSLVLKAHLKQRTDLTMMHDRCAARVSVHYLDHLAMLTELVVNAFDCPEGPEDKGVALGVDGIGYRGVHCDVRIDRGERAGLDAIRGEVWCEIQLHTLASELWANSDHDLGYKTTMPLPAMLARSINRLSVLTEIYDDGLLQVRRTIEAHDDYPVAQLGRILASVFYGVTGVISDERDLSDEVVRVVMPVVEGSPAEYGARIRAFVNREKQRLDAIYEQRDPRVFGLSLLLLPAALLVFEQLETNEPMLRDAWSAALPISWLDGLLVAWGGLDD
jgi:ppGpp synthetase/RelA/SpoT-type nucleotidyltranferase